MLISFKLACCYLFLGIINPYFFKIALDSSVIKN